MIWFALFPAIAFFARGLVYSTFSVAPNDHYPVVMLMMIGAILPAMLLAEFIGACDPRKTVGPYLTELHELNIPERRGVFLGTRNVAGGPVYFYDAIQSDGSYLPGRLWVYGVNVYEENRKDAVMETRYNQTAWSWGKLIGFTQGSTASYAFRIPKGSIQPGFTY